MTEINSIQDFRDGVKVVTGHDIYLAGLNDQEVLAKCYIELYEDPVTESVPDSVLDQHYRVYPGGAVIEDVRNIKDVPGISDYLLVIENQEYPAWDDDNQYTLAGLEEILYDYLYGSDE